MKIIFLLSLCISFQLQASEKCFLYEVQGVVQIKNSDMQLVVNKDSMSEFIFSIKSKDAHRFAPYLDVTTVGAYIFKGKPQSKATVESIVKVARGTPDPLNHMKHSYVKELKVIECP